MTQPLDAPLLEERVGHVSVGRAQALVVELQGGREYSLAVGPRRATTRDSEAAVLASSAWQQEESPFPPPSWPGQFIGTDSETRGEWIGTYGNAGYALFGFDPPPVAPNQFCASENNMNTMQIACDEPAATITDIDFASYGTPTGKCPSFSVGKCNAANSTAIVKQACIGKHSWVQRLHFEQRVLSTADGAHHLVSCGGALAGAQSTLTLQCLVTRAMVSAKSS